MSKVSSLDTSHKPSSAVLVRQLWQCSRIAMKLLSYSSGSSLALLPCPQPSAPHLDGALVRNPVCFCHLEDCQRMECHVSDICSCHWCDNKMAHLDLSFSRTHYILPSIDFELLLDCSLVPGDCGEQKRSTPRHQLMMLLDVLESHWSVG